MRLGIAEIDEHAVAHILGDKTAKARDGVGDTAMVGADDLAQILGIEAGGQRRRTDQIAEHHRQLPPLGLSDGSRSGGRRRRCLRCVERGNRVEQSPAMTTQHHAEILQIFCSELRQRLPVDLVLAKRWRISLKTEAS